MADNENGRNEDVEENDQESIKEPSPDSLGDLSDDNLLADRDSTDGCKHYERKCAFISPCCKKQYTCRVCHDDEESHQIDRYSVTNIICLKCNTTQQTTNDCSNCSIKFADYYCEICHLYDKDKRQYHCKPCGLCRVGGRENFFHCSVCDLCLANSLKDSHKCVERASRSNCPVCMEDLHTSRKSNNVLPCSHLMHQLCFQDMMKTGNYACPICAKSMVPMTEVWGLMDREVAQTEMPQEYKNTNVQILCRDCNQESRVKFHVVGLKCTHCGSYNTCRTAEKDDPEEGATGLANGDASNN